MSVTTEQEIWNGSRDHMIIWLKSHCKHNYGNIPQHALWEILNYLEHSEPTGDFQPWLEGVDPR